MGERVSEFLTRIYEDEQDGPFNLMIVHAVALAREAEYQADRATTEVMQNVRPTYPPWVRMLVDAMRKRETGRGD